MIKEINYPINVLSKNRWSPRAFSDKIVEKDKLHSIMEAARWSASAFNEQPWRFLVAYKGEESYQNIMDTLVEFNQMWAKKAPVLILNCYRINLSRNGKHNQTAQYDLGQAVAHYSLEAINQGLYIHQMTGFDVSKANKLFGLGEEIVAFSVTALGYIGGVDSLPEDIRKMEMAEPIRMHQKDFLLNDL
ncbi:MAG: nitroreductase family protein [Bacteroidales bacterium]|nr:nitroreductase family protein [Bacteroidales bacterium]